MSLMRFAQMEDGKGKMAYVHQKTDNFAKEITIYGKKETA